MPKVTSGAKRPKNSRVCRLCSSCKTRCEELTGLGCKRCREKKRLCSLISERDLNSLHDAHGSDQEVDEVTNTVDQSHGLSTSSFQALAAAAAPSTETVFPGDRVAAAATPLEPNNAYLGSWAHATSDTVAPARHTTNSYPCLDGVLNSLQFDETFLSPSHASEFPDVLALGLMTADQVEHSYMIFQRHFTALLPLPPYCLLEFGDTVQHHPFMTLATLAHTPTATSIPLSKMIDQSLRVVMAGAVSVEIMGALFILSLAPGMEDAATRSPVTSAWYLELAYSIGRRLSIEPKTRVSLDNPASLCESWSARALEMILLWENIKTKLNLHLRLSIRTSLALTRVADLIPSNAHLLPDDHPKEAYRCAIQHVKVASRISSAYHPILRNTVWDENQGFTLGPRPELDQKEWRDLQTRLKELSTEPGINDLLQCDIVCISHSLTSRFAIIARTLPTPLASDRLGMFLGLVASIIFPAGSNLVQSLDSIDDARLSRLPSYQTTIYVFGALLLRRINSYLSPPSQGSELPNRPDLIKIGHMENRLAKAGTFARTILDKGKRLFDKGRGDVIHANDPVNGIADGASWSDLSFWNVDFSVFDFDLFLASTANTQIT